MRHSTEQIIDELLVLDAQNGQCDAFDSLVSRWQKRLWAHAYQLTGRADAAWDITQEAWLNIVRGLSKLEDPAKFGSWAYRIVSNKTYDWIKRHGHTPPTEIQTEERAEPHYEQSQDGPDIHGILLRLPVNSQAVLKLYYLEGFDLAEIAAILRAPPGTIKSRLHTARIEFRKLWESLNKPAEISTSAKGTNHE